MKTPAQPTVLKFLSDPASYPHRPRKVTLVQTHSSWVFLSSPYVYKIKKPVNFGFLDFSTLAKRKHFCLREVELNRRLSPHVYLGVVPITVCDGRLAIDGPGCNVEYAVKMRRLHGRGFLDRLVKRGAVGRSEINRIATKLAGFYLAQHPTAEVEAWGRTGRLKISTDENFVQTRPFVGDTISETAFATIRGWTNRFFRHHAKRFTSRISKRWIRDCHGDLHLEHIHLTEKAINVYDCIEFNDRFRYVDVASDIAFLAMDLDFKGRSDLAVHLVERMSKLLDDPGLTGLMDFYKCYRAYVRGKVESLHSVATGITDGERTESSDLARRYFQQALNYPVAGSHPMVLVVMGRVGSGKSTLARALGQELGWPVVSSDRTRKEIAGVPAHERVTGARRERLYSKAMTARTYRRLLSEAQNRLRARSSVIVDATFSLGEQRRWLIDQLENRQQRFRFVEAGCPDRIIRKRLGDREGGDSEVSDARLEDFDLLTQRYEPPHELPRNGCVTVSTNGSLKRTLMRALQLLTS